jgi:hypothetical protein
MDSPGGRQAFETKGAPLSFWMTSVAFTRSPLTMLADGRSNDTRTRRFCDALVVLVESALDGDRTVVDGVAWTALADFALPPHPEATATAPMMPIAIVLMARTPVRRAPALNSSLIPSGRTRTDCLRSGTRMRTPNGS